MGPDLGASGSAADFLPADHDLPSLRQAVQHCRGCDLYKQATQAVFGQGPSSCPLMLVGEVPGDREDQAREPFVGPAGRLLDKALAEVGIDRQRAYVTNAVKHFKWQTVGRRRIHRKPTLTEIRACRPWLDAEIQAVAPALIVCLGATAGQALLGRGFRVTRQRGAVLDRPNLPPTMATVHPSSLLRLFEPYDHDEAWQAFLADLRVAAERIAPT